MRSSSVKFPPYYLMRKISLVELVLEDLQLEIADYTFNGGCKSCFPRMMKSRFCWEKIK